MMSIFEKAWGLLKVADQPPEGPRNPNPDYGREPSNEMDEAGSASMSAMLDSPQETCPCCDGWQMSRDDVDSDGTDMWTWWHCEDCGCKWYENYRFDHGAVTEAFGPSGKLGADADLNDAANRQHLEDRGGY